MDAPNDYQLELLEKAMMHLSEEGYSDYLQLKRLITEKPAGFQYDFRKIYTHYYGLNMGGLSDAFKDRYFDILFHLKLERNVDPYTPILKELFDIPRRKGDRALQCSFVSKLVAIHDESYPIFDRYVSEFFGITVPSCGNVDFRIAGFVTNLTRLRETYRCWSADTRFQSVIAQVNKRHPLLQDCADPRIADFLVWATGRMKLGKS